MAVVEVVAVLGMGMLLVAVSVVCWYAWMVGGFDAPARSGAHRGDGGGGARSAGRAPGAAAAPGVVVPPARRALHRGDAS
jgi:L-rhamnose isomerase